MWWEVFVTVVMFAGLIVILMVFAAVSLFLGAVILRHVIRFDAEE
jgi:hypothetical protein